MKIFFCMVVARRDVIILTRQLFFFSRNYQSLKPVSRKVVSFSEIFSCKLLKLWFSCNTEDTVKSAKQQSKEYRKASKNYKLFLGGVTEMTNSFLRSIKNYIRCRVKENEVNCFSPPNNERFIKYRNLT